MTSLGNQSKWGVVLPNSEKSVHVSTTDAETTAALQRGRPFQPGHSGNPAGRPKGAKNRLTTIFVATVTEDFVLNGQAALAKLRADDPAAYLKIVASILPRELVLQMEQEPDFSEMTDEEAAECLGQAYRNQRLMEALRQIQQETVTSSDQQIGRFRAKRCCDPG